MESAPLTSADYWESDEVDLRLNPRRDFDAGGLVPFLVRERGISGAVVLATSGSSGAAKFVVLSKRALLRSADAVIERLGMTGADVTLAGLSDFHVGGLGQFARAHRGGGKVVDCSGQRWRRDGGPWIEAIREAGATQTSMTPTHLHDLVRNEVQCPDSMRTVLLGGGRVDPAQVSRARELGWPIRVSYGMTEASSQVATALDEEVEWLPVLPHWECRLDEDGRLALRGEALFTGYARKRGGKWRFDPARDAGGWFTTSDRCELDGARLRFVGRADDSVKVSGELVSLSRLNHIAERVARRFGGEATLVALPDPRREHRLVLVLGGIEEPDRVRIEIEAEADRIERIDQVVGVPRLPRTEIGKVDRVAVEAIAREG